MTSQGLRDFSLAEINAIFLDKIKEIASEYQTELNNREPVKKAVITVPKYFRDNNISNPMIYDIIEAANLSGIEIIDIIEEIHADLLYYMSNEKYFGMIKPGKKVAIFDIGGGTCICKIYEISEYKNKMYGTCIKSSYGYNDDDDKYSGRDIDNIIVEELEKSITEDLKNKVKLRTLEEAKKIKHRLSFEERIK